MSYSGYTTEEDRRKAIRNAPDVIEAVKRAAAFVNVDLADFQAKAIAEAARSYADAGELVIRQSMRREQWTIEGFRDHVRQRMRHELLDTVTRQGLIPVDLPAESLKYMDRWFMPTDDLERPQGIPAEAVEAGAEWETVILTLSVPVRKPPVDRAKAVKAGILTGGSQ